MTPTPEERAKLRELHAAATPGKWGIGDENNESAEVSAGTVDVRIVFDRIIPHTHPTQRISRQEMVANAELTVAAHNAIPGLLAALDAAEKEIARLKADKSEAYAMRMDAAEAEVARIKAGGCARDQRTTQHCAEAATLAVENKRLREALAAYECWMRDVINTDACWPNGPQGTPTLTQLLYERFLLIRPAGKTFGESGEAMKGTP